MMVNRKVSMWVVGVVSVCILAAVGGCPDQTADTNSGTNTGTNTGTDANDQTSLTSAETDAAMAAAKSCESLGDAVNVTKSSTDSEDSQSSFEVPTFPTGERELNFGVCPQVALSVESDGQVVFDMNIDFGDTGCNPAGSTEFTCTGSASGTFDQHDQELAVSFESISCNDSTLTGDANLTYELDNTSVSLDGDWDLTYVDDVGTILTDGAGTGNYDASALSITVSDFTGTISDTEFTYNATLSNIQMSYATYGNLIPYAGDATISGTDIRTLIVRFSTDSPSTGSVEVSVAGGPFFEVSLY